MSTAADTDPEFGTTLLPRDLNDDELAAAPILATLDSLLIEGLTEDEDDAFQVALAQ